MALVPPQIWEESPVQAVPQVAVPSSAGSSPATEQKHCRGWVGLGWVGVGVGVGVGVWSWRLELAFGVESGSGRGWV